MTNWLGDDLAPDPIGPKNHAYAYLAKWYARYGCADFFRAIWREAEVKAELERILEASGAAAVLRAMVDDAGD